MNVIEVQNVNLALDACVDTIRRDDNWRTIAPRDGKTTREYREPVTTVYRKPWQRVLFSAARDANPFFHLMESLWMLQGRNDARWIGYFSKNISQFAEDDGMFHGAYGHRWRYHWPLDQLWALVNLLTESPDTRRAVISMWDPADDLRTSRAVQKRDIPCNTNIYFKVREGVLEMTVCCRSNDVIWGTYGANAVHFSVLQEYVASALDVEIGTYTHVSDSWHYYVDNPFIKKIVESGEDEYESDNRYYSRHAPRVNALSMISDFGRWNAELNKFMVSGWADPVIYEETFFRHVALPMRMAWEAYKNGDLGAARVQATEIKAPDWQAACVEWIQRRIDRRKESE